MEDPQSSDESRMIFDYSRITELFFGAHMELNSKIYNHLSNSRYEYLFSADLKHVYFIVLLYPDDKHYFAFTISGIG